MPDANRPLTIVQMIPSLVVGGAETFATQLAEEQLRQGHDVHLVCVSGDGPLDARLSDAMRARRHVIGKRHRWDATVLPRLGAQLRDLQPDVVHTHLFTSLSWGTVAARAAGIPVVLHTQHACHDDEYRYLPAVRRQLSRAVDVVVGCSEATVADIRRRDYAPHAGRITCVENGIPLANRPRATLQGDSITVGTVGRMVPIKGQRHLIEAIAALHVRGVPARLVMVGDGPLRAELEALVDVLGLVEHVEFTGQVANVAEQLARFDVFALPSLSEAMPITALEAAAAGLPLLMTTGGGGRTLIDAGAGGWVVEPGDERALCDRLLDYAHQSVAARRALGDASHDLAMARYSIDATARRYDALYREALAANQVMA